MQELTGLGRNIGRLVLLGALPWAACGQAADAISAAPGSNGPEIMFYFKQPLGASHATRTYGLRIDQASISGGTPGGGMAQVGRRELVNLQVGGPDRLRIDIARRLTWDMGRRQLGAINNHSDMALRFSARALSAPPRQTTLP